MGSLASPPPSTPRPPPLQPPCHSFPFMAVRPARIRPLSPASPAPVNPASPWTPLASPSCPLALAPVLSFPPTSPLPPPTHRPWQGVGDTFDVVPLGGFYGKGKRTGDWPSAMWCVGVDGVWCDAVQCSRQAGSRIQMSQGSLTRVCAGPRRCKWLGVRAPVRDACRVSCRARCQAWPAPAPLPPPPPHGAPP